MNHLAIREGLCYSHTKSARDCEMPKAIAYIRYSSAIQADGDSIERQKAPLEAFEERFSVKISEIISDEGVSSFRGDNIKRGKFSQILEKNRIG